MGDLISRQAVLDLCEKAADTCREIYMGVLDKVGHGESEASAFGACAYFMQKETMYRHEIPSIVAQVDKAAQWIPVAERLPKHGEDVIMLFETGIVCGGFICESGTWCAYSDGEYYTDCSNNPTHWMPPPEPPETKEEPVKHGRWIGKVGRAACSVCSNECWADSVLEYDYCPACGAKMDAEVSV